MIRFACALLLFASTSYSPQSLATTYSIGDKCYLPGLYASNRCSVRWSFSGNTQNKILCLWNSDSLSVCQGYDNYADSFDYVTSSGNTLEIRQHAVWPTSDPAWPNAHTVRLNGALVHSRALNASVFAVPNPPCTVVVEKAGGIQNAMNQSASNAVICVGPGTKVVSNLNPKAGQVLRSADLNAKAILKNPGLTTGERIIESSSSGITIRDIIVEGNLSMRPEFGIVLGGVSQTVESVDVSYALIGIGINGGVNEQISNSTVSFAGDGVACSGCAEPSIWVNNSADVRILESSVLNNGVGPEGDGEIACYNTNDFLARENSVSYSGAAGLFVVNCDNAQLLGNQVDHSKEWGFDIVNGVFPSGSDYGLFLGNTISYSRNGGVVLKDSQAALFKNNTYLYNRQGPSASGSCNGVNLRGNNAGFRTIGDTSTPSGANCSD